MIGGRIHFAPDVKHDRSGWIKSDGIAYINLGRSPSRFELIATLPVATSPGSILGVTEGENNFVYACGATGTPYYQPATGTVETSNFGTVTWMRDATGLFTALSVIWNDIVYILDSSNGFQIEIGQWSGLDTDYATCEGLIADSKTGQISHGEFYSGFDGNEYSGFDAAQTDTPTYPQLVIAGYNYSDHDLHMKIGLADFNGYYGFDLSTSSTTGCLPLVNGARRNLRFLTIDEGSYFDSYPDSEWWKAAYFTIDKKWKVKVNAVDYGIEVGNNESAWPTDESWPQDHPMFLFAHNDGSGNPLGRGCGAAVHRLRLRDEEGNVTADYVPVERNGEALFYELITGKFFGNCAGSGSLTYGTGAVA